MHTSTQFLSHVGNAKSLAAKGGDGEVAVLLVCRDEKAVIVSPINNNGFYQLPAAAYELLTDVKNGNKLKLKEGMLQGSCPVLGGQEAKVTVLRLEQIFTNFWDAKAQVKAILDASFRRSPAPTVADLIRDYNFYSKDQLVRENVSRIGASNLAETILKDNRVVPASQKPQQKKRAR